MPTITGLAFGVAKAICVSTYCLFVLSALAVGASVKVILVPVGMLRFPVMVSPAFKTYLASVAAWSAVISSHKEPVEINVRPLLAGVGSPLTM